jgi:hypothetical protein
MEQPNLTQEISDLRKRIEELESALKQHQHLGVDGSKELNGETPLEGKEINIHGAGSQTGDFVSLPINIFDGSKKANQPKRVCAYGIYTAGTKETTTEQINAILYAGKNLTPEEAEKQKFTNRVDFDKVNSANLILIHSPLGLDFLHAYRTPIVNGQGRMVVGETIITDDNADFVVNQLAGSIITLFDAAGTILETRTISSNTSNTITVDSAWFTASGIYTYSITKLIYLGSANNPFKRLYVADDIRLGYGASGGSQVQYIKWGSGSPEGAITANPGSLYLNRSGGANTTLYIKESGTGNTGWIAK